MMATAALEPNKNESQLGLSNEFMRKVARKIAPQLFIDVESCDELQHYDEYFERSGAIIINTAEKHNVSGHFVLLFVDVNKEEIHLFDSLTVAFMDPNVVEYLQRIRKAHPNYKLHFSPFVIQSPLQSSLCGVYVLSYLSNLTKKCGEKSMEEYYSQFSETNMEKNEATALRILLNFIINCRHRGQPQK